MAETELKITLSEESEKALLTHAALERLRTKPRRTQNLVSTYYDTPDQALARAGLSLRMRKAGRHWVQTIKRAAHDGAAGHGFFAREEAECPAPGGKLNLEASDDTGLHAAVLAAICDQDVAPVFQTRVRRITENLHSPIGSSVELAIDQGEIIAGEHCAAIREAELELVSGDVRGIFDIARTLFQKGPLVFSTATKNDRGYRLARTGMADAPVSPVKAGDLHYTADTAIETVAQDVFRDCYRQISCNMVVVGMDLVPEGPHQLRIGLRRLRTALQVLGPMLGGTGLGRLATEAQRLGRVVGALRDMDVLIGDVVVPAAAEGLDDRARDGLLAALEQRRETIRTDVRAVLAEPDTTRFLLDLAELVEARGWLDPSDHAQTVRLATTTGKIAPDLLRACTRKVRKKARSLDSLDVHQLHELRKQLKKLRYTADILDPIYGSKKVTTYIRSLKEMQDTFGSLNDATMATQYLTGPDAPGRDDPDIQRAVGWVLGVLALRVQEDRPKLFRRWKKFAGTRSFWA